ncbi:MAG: D-arabinono-1,4-lactone oxidase [Myxococcales bacterium]|jgi:hypothetical protein
MARPQFPFTEVKRMHRWTNFSATLPTREIPVYCTPDVLGTVADDAPHEMLRHGEALKAILDHCHEGRGRRLRAIGSRWSFSRVIEPEEVVLDPANMSVILKVKPDWVTPAYREQRPGHTPVYAQGGAGISRINRRLGESNLALRTSGAGDGHRLAGCIATGTHGSALGIGALHDTVLGVHLVLASDRALFVQPQTSPSCSDDVAAWLGRQTGIPTAPLNDDEVFAAAQVSLGSLGFVGGVVLDTVDLYRLQGETVARPWSDATLWTAIRTLDVSALKSPSMPAGQPYHFEVVMHPYPSQRGRGAFARMLWKVGADDTAFESPSPATPATSSDTMGLIAKLSGLVDMQVATLALRHILSEQLAEQFPAGEVPPTFPGVLFGPTSLPPGHGASTEVFTPHERVEDAIELLYDVLRDEAAEGRHLLGPVALRFVPATSSLLGMNIHPMNCCIELPSIRNNEVLGIYRSWWNRLADHQVPFTCHWGQLHALTPEGVTAYFGNRATRWKAARDRLLPSSTARRIFDSPMLADVGLA